MQPLVIWHCWL